MPSYKTSGCTRCGTVNKCKGDLCSKCQKTCGECGAPKGKQSATCKGCYSTRQRLNPSLYEQMHSAGSRAKATEGLNKFFEEVGKSRQKDCLRCGVRFNASHSRPTTCPKCSAAIAGKNRRNRREAVCAVCSKSFEHVGSRDAKYCSKDCWNIRNPPVVKTCEMCGKAFETRDRSQKNCSKRCANKWRSKHLRGPNAVAWKDGKSLERERLRLGAEVKEWKRLVHARDNYTCQHCGHRGKGLHAHHIKEWAKHPELRFEVNNGLTLCALCHGKVHGKIFRVRGKAKPVKDDQLTLELSLSKQ